MIGVPEAEPSGPVIPDAALDRVLAELLILRSARIAHGALSTETIVVDDDGSAGFVDFRTASTVATVDQLDRDTAAALAAVAVVAGPQRAVAAAVRTVPPEVIVAALPHLQRAALDPVASRTLRGKKALLVALRDRVPPASGWRCPNWSSPDGSVGSAWPWWRGPSSGDGP